MKSRDGVWDPQHLRLWSPLYAQRVGRWAGWSLLVWVVMFWRLGDASFWDPDEAVYAQATRAMMRSGDWLVPTYNGQPFFDKPILFYWLQLLAFHALGATESGARIVPAVSGVGVVIATRWAGAAFFDLPVGRLAAL